MNTAQVRIAGHFGEWLQGRISARGPVVLVTLCCPALYVDTRNGSGAAMCLPFDRIRLERFRRALRLPPDPWPTLYGNMRLGCGTGASTAMLVALARAGGFDGTPGKLARACLAVEGASDPLMMPAPDALLWASRQAQSLRALTPPPRCVIVGGYWGAPQPTDPRDNNFADIGDLIEAWEIATENGNLAAAARLATVSAMRCAGSHTADDPMPALARDLNALGHIRAHTGSARGLVFAPDAVPDSAEAALLEAGLAHTLRFVTGGP